MRTERLPEAWASTSPWTHRRVRWGLRWLPRTWAVRYRRCVTHAPATVCNCRMYAVFWGQFPAAEGVEDACEVT
jgi:hypothetical protein